MPVIRSPDQVLIQVKTVGVCGSEVHACPVWYAALAERGYFDKVHLGTLRRLNSILQGHPDMRKTPGIDMTAGTMNRRS